MKKVFQKTLLIPLTLLLGLSILASGLLANGSLKASAAPLKSGPVSMPYMEVQAEDSATNGTVIGPDRAYPSLAGEAIGRQAVTLDATGEYVEFTVPQSANAIVMRYSIPDSLDGMGLTAPLSLYINNVQQPDLTLTSKYAWYYGNYPFTNNPAEIRPHHFYDDVHVMTAQLSPGDTVRVQMDASATAPSYTIDLMDFEQVAGALSEPSNSLDLVDDYSADPTGVSDSTTALQTAVNAASAQGKTLWIPEGTYKLTDNINIPNNVTMQGAGMWYSTLHFVNGTGNSSGLFGGSPSLNFHAADFAIFGEVTQRDDSDQMNGFGGGFSHSTITRVWMEHLKVGAWLDGPFTDLTISNVVIRNVTADGINFHQAVTNSTVTQSILRNTGDDGLAMWTHNLNDKNNTFSFNRVEIPVLANGIAIYGGKDNNITDNYVGDQQTAGGGIHVGNRFDSVPVSGTINILRNTIVRSGSQDYYNSWNFGTGAMWFYSLEAPMSATINVNDNVLIDNNYEAFHFIGNNAITNISFDNNQIIGAGTYGVESRMTSGSVSFANTTVYGLGRGGYYQKPFLGDINGDICTPPSAFTIVDGGNNGDLDLGNPLCVLPYPSPVYGAIPTATPTLTATPCPGVCPTATATATSTPTIDYVRIKNKWTGQYLYDDGNGAVKYSYSGATDATSHWEIQNFAGHQRIKNRETGNYMAIQNLLAYVESIQVCDVCTSGQWDIQDAPDAGYKIIRSVYHPWQIVNVEHQTGYAEYTSDQDVQVSWGSPQWSFETAPDPVENTATPTPGTITYIRIKNKWQNTYLYEDTETVKYGTPESTDPASHWLLEDYSGYKRIKNRATGNYMAIENLLAYVQSIQVCGPCTSGQWEIQDAPSAGYKIIRSVYHPWQIINVEQQTGYAEYTSDVTVPVGNDSAQWLFETAPDPVTPTPGPGSNLAQGKSIVDNGHTGSFTASKANDGNTSTYWEGSGYPNTLTVDLGSAMTIGSVRVKVNPNMVWNARTQTIEVWESTDNSTFNSLVAATAYNFDPNTGNQVTIDFTQLSTRYVRLTFTTNSEAPNGQAAEFEVYETTPGAPTATPTSAPVNYIRIKNKWQSTYLYEDAGAVKYGNPAAGDAASHWAIENLSGHQFIRNRATGNYMAIEGLLAYVQSLGLCEPCQSYQWDITDAPSAGYKTIRSVWHPWQIINVEQQTGYAEYTSDVTVPVANDSAQWAFETAPDPATATPTVTPTQTEEATLTPTASATSVVTATATLTPSLTPTVTRTPTASATRTITRTVTMTPTKTATPTKTVTPTETPITLTLNSIPVEDGWILESTETSGTGGTMDSTATTFRLGDEVANKQYRSILSFNTTLLPDTAVIQTAVLKIKQNGTPVGTDPFTILGSVWADIRTGTFGAGALELADFNAAASVNAAGAFNSTPVSNVYSLTMNAAARNAINKLGRTQIRLRFGVDDNNDNAADYMKFLSGDFTSGQPQLVITYTIP